MMNEKTVGGKRAWSAEVKGGWVESMEKEGAKK